MKPLWAVPLVLVIALPPSGVFATDSERPGEPALDLRFRLATAPAVSPGGARLSLFLATGAGGTSTPLGLAAPRWTSSTGGLRTYEMSRADCAIKGLGAGATLGLWVGALAKTTHAWDERTSWYVAGAAAAAGALLGGTVGVESAGWRTNYDWEE